MAVGDAVTLSCYYNLENVSRSNETVSKRQQQHTHTHTQTRLLASFISSSTSIRWCVCSNKNEFIATNKIFISDVYPEAWMNERASERMCVSMVLIAVLCVHVYMSLFFFLFLKRRICVKNNFLLSFPSQLLSWSQTHSLSACHWLIFALVKDATIKAEINKIPFRNQMSTSSDLPNQLHQSEEVRVFEKKKWREKGKQHCYCVCDFRVPEPY